MECFVFFSSKSPLVTNITMIRKFVVFFLFVTIHEMFFVLLGMNDPINTILFFLRVVDFAAGVAAEPSERAGIVSGRSALRRQGVLGGRASIGRGSCNSCPSREVRGKPGGDSFFFLLFSGWKVYGKPFYLFVVPGIVRFMLNRHRRSWMFTCAFRCTCGGCAIGVPIL